MMLSRDPRRPRRAWCVGSLTLLLWLIVCAPMRMAASELQPGEWLGLPPEFFEAGELAQLQEALVSLPIATALGAALALRPRRPATPPRSTAVVQTQIILAIIGALVMLVVGTSLARAFGVVGVAGLIRYRAKINDPKDAGVMLTTLAIGLCAGAGLYGIAVFAAFFVLGVLWLVESFEPTAHKLFALKVAGKQALTLQPRIEELLRRRRTTFELRTASPEEVCYEVELPLQMKTDALSNAIRELDPKNGTAVEWDQKKEKKS